MNKTQHFQNYHDDINIYSDTSRQNGKQRDKKRKKPVVRIVLPIVAGVLVLAILGSVAAYTLVLKKIWKLSSPETESSASRERAALRSGAMSPGPLPQSPPNAKAAPSGMWKGASAPQSLSEPLKV